MFVKATALLTCLVTLIPNATAKGIIRSEYSSYVEVSTGSHYTNITSLPGPSTNNSKIVHTRLSDKQTCAVSAYYPGGPSIYPMLNVTVGDVPCKKDSLMAAEVPELGAFMVNFHRDEDCGGVSKTCDPVLTINGQNFQMWDGEDCEHRIVTAPKGMSYETYEVYRCGFNGRP